MIINQIFREAIKQGADYIECDIVVTKDLKLYCNHDPWLSKITPNLSTHQEFSSRRKMMPVFYEDPYDDSYVEWNITDWFFHDFTEDELKSLKRIQTKKSRDPNFDLKEGFCSFQEFIDIAKESNVGIYPELKYPFFVNSILRSRGDNTSLEDLVLDILNKNGYNQRNSKCFIQCFEKKSLEYVRTKTNLKRVYLLWEDQAHLRNLDSNNRLLKNKQMWSSALDWAKKEKIDGFGLDKSFIVSENKNGYVSNSYSYMIEESKGNGILTHVYTFAHDEDHFPWNYGKDPYLEYQFYADMGIDGFFTDFPATAKRFLEARSYRSGNINSAALKKYDTKFFYLISVLLKLIVDRYQKIHSCF